MGRVKNNGAKKTDSIEAYRKDICAQANEILNVKVPNRLEHLDEMLLRDQFQIEYQVEAREFAVTSLKKYEDDVKAKEAEEAAKMKQEESKKDEDETENEDGDHNDDKKQKNTPDKIDQDIDEQNNNEDAEDEDKVVKKRKSNEHNVDEPSKKKRKEKSSDDMISVKLKNSVSNMSLDKPDPKIVSNEKIMSMMSELKPEFIEMVSICVTLRNWITIHIPKVEDGNNFGVEVQEDALSELKSVEDITNQMIEEQAAYYLARGQILEKIAQDASIEDFKVFIYDEDEKQCRRLRTAAIELRTNYTIILDLINKNYEKLIKPRGNSSNTTIMY